MEREKKMAKKVKKSLRTVRLDIPNRFSEHYNKYVKPHIKSEISKKYLEDIMNYDVFQRKTKPQLIEMAKDLQSLANTRIGTYLSSRYYRGTKEYENIPDRIANPTPEAYRNLIERTGGINKFSMNVENMDIRDLRRRLLTVGLFLVSESSLLGRYSKGAPEKSYGQYRILGTRQQYFMDALLSDMGKTEKTEWLEQNKDYVSSQTFAKKFWKVFAQLSEVTKFQSFKYEKEKVSMMITKELVENKRIRNIDYFVEKLQSKISEAIIKNETPVYAGSPFDNLRGKR